jgi:23S rRNA U2552 (ribose-2'-O)-methylase RlmE/FtsJ
MVSIEVRHDEASNLAVCVVRGSVTARDLMDAIEANFGARPTSNVIWDLTRSNLSNLDVGALIEVSDCAARFSGKRVNPRTINVVKDTQETFLIKLYGEISEMRNSPVDYVMAASLEEAYAKLDIADPFQTATDASR